MSLDAFLRKEPVRVYLTSEDQMCLRRLTEYDVHHPEDLTADEAKAGVVGVAISWVLSTFRMLTNVDGRLVLHHSDDHYEEVDWADMFQQAIDDGGGVDANTELLMGELFDIKFIDITCEVWMGIMEKEVDRGDVIRFAIRWRYYGKSKWLQKQRNPDNPELGIVFTRAGSEQFGLIVP